MFNKASLLFFLLLVQLMYSNAIAKKDTVSLKINEKVQQLFDRGMQEYTNGKYKEAIATWKTVVIKAEAAKIEQLTINTNTNIGACYNALGYHKTALSYFLKTDKLLSAMGPKKDIYWINHINIGVCYMSIEQWDLAKYYFDQTINYNDHVVFLKYLNLAKWNAEKGNKIAFFRYQIKLNNLISKFPTYKDPWDEMQLDFLTLWEEKSRLKVLLQELQSDYNNGSIYTKLAYNNAFFLVHGRLYEKLSNVLAYNQEIVQENNFYLKDLYYSLLKKQYLKQNDLKEYSKYTDFAAQNMEGLNKENKMIFAEDFKTAKILEELVNKFTAEKLKSNLTQIQLDKSRLQLQLSISLILLGLGLVFLINRNHKKSKQISTLKQIESENQLLKNKIEKIELTNHLKLTEEELNTSITTIKKIMLLKKQLENITNDKLEQSESEIRKQTKLILNTFFDNYRELYTLIYKKRNYDTILKDIKIKFPEINDREIEIINYILLKFTNKEIAILLDKSVKSIEYNRSQIRKKIGLNPEDSLEEYLELC